MSQPLMPKATAVWLIDNTTLTFDQIAEFTGMHALEIAGIADGEVAVGIKGFDPIANNQLTRKEIERCEQSSKARLKLLKPASTPEQKKKRPRYTPVSKRQDRPAAIDWLIKNHPELADSQISKLLGTTKQTIEAIRSKTHWNSATIEPIDPVALGLCRQIDLDAAVRIAAQRSPHLIRTAQEKEGGLLSTEESLNAEISGGGALNPFGETETPSLEQVEAAFGQNFEAAPEDDKENEEEYADPEALFDLPKVSKEDNEEER